MGKPSPSLLITVASHRFISALLVKENVDNAIRQRLASLNTASYLMQVPFTLTVCENNEPKVEVTVGRLHGQMFAARSNGHIACRLHGRFYCVPIARRDCLPLVRSSDCWPIVRTHCLPLARSILLRADRTGRLSSACTAFLLLTARTVHQKLCSALRRRSFNEDRPHGANP